MSVIISILFFGLFIWFVSKDGKSEAAGTLGCMGIIAVAFVLMMVGAVIVGIMISMATM